MSTTILEITTSDGPCSTEIVTPDGDGPWPAVVLCFDAAGRRKATTELAERIARDGYLVATPDLYHRGGSVADFLPPGTEVTLDAVRAIFGDAERRARFGSEMYAPAIDYANLRTTIGAVLDHLAGRKDSTDRVGTVGYCMGGNAAMRLATLFGGEIAATVAIHPGGLVSDQPDSMHLRCEQIRSPLVIAAAEEDGSFSEAAKATLTAALDAAKVRYTLETYPARHGFGVRDNTAYDQACAERALAAAADLFARALR